MIDRTPALSFHSIAVQAITVYHRKREALDLFVLGVKRNDADVVLVGSCPRVSIVCFASSWQQRCVFIFDVTRVETERLQCGQRNNKCCVRVGYEHTTC